MVEHLRQVECPYCGKKFLDCVNGKTVRPLPKIKINAYETTCPECKKSMFVSRTLEMGIQKD